MELPDVVDAEFEVISEPDRRCWLEKRWPDWRDDLWAVTRIVFGIYASAFVYRLIYRLFS
jgi:hypothetical protein